MIMYYNFFINISMSYMQGSWFKFYLIMQGIAAKYIINILLGTHYSQKAREGAQNTDPTPVFLPVCENL